MNTNVPTVEPGEDVTVNFEETPMSCPEAPEISDVALFEQQVSHTARTLGITTSASKLGTGQEQTEGLINLSQKFRALLEKEAPRMNVHNTLPNSSGDNQAISEIDKKIPLSHKELLLGTGVPDMQAVKTGVPVGKTSLPSTEKGGGVGETNVSGAERNVPIDVQIKKMKVSVNSSGTIKRPTGSQTMPLGKSIEVEYSSTQTDPLKKETVSFQDNPYVAPVVSPLISLSSTIPTSEVLKAHAALISQQIKDQIIDRILVSTNDIAANKTVKVVISPTVLEGTEVNFQKVGDTLSVQFVSRNEGSLQFLQVNQADLQGYLQGELKQFKDVAVSIKTNENSAESPEDGRSRNRYEYQNQDEDEQ